MNWFFFEDHQSEIMEIFCKCGYVQVDFGGRNGVFYAKGIDPENYYVSNPYGIY